MAQERFELSNVSVNKITELKHFHTAQYKAMKGDSAERDWHYQLSLDYEFMLLMIQDYKDGKILS